jgi:hypothetical protein
MMRTAPLLLGGLLAVSVALFSRSSAVAHSGGLNAQGCHTNRAAAGACHADLVSNAEVSV